ncbi:MAG: hypothetical protein GEU96_22910, partial [Propionibacteriales bacterium]|nr:hypothetical protein [Propionibacteriales bacterium]
ANKTSHGWSSSRFDLSSLAGQSVRLRFALWSDGNSPDGSILGWSVDDVSLHGCSFKTSTSIGAAPSIVSYGTSTSITGVVKRPSGDPVAGAPARLYRRATSSSAWSQVASTTASDTGAYAFSFKPSRNYQYQVRFAGTTTYAASTSGAVTVRVSPVVTRTVSAWSRRVGQTVTFSGSVSPRHPGSTVYLQRFTGGAWRNAKSGRLSSTSRYAIAWTIDKPYTYSWRVYLPGHSDHFGAVSAPVTVRIIR